VGGVRDTIVLLTSRYPFGSGETFLDAELPILARRFARVIVVPSAHDDNQRALPSGVRCDRFLADASSRNLGRELLRHPGRAPSQYARAILEEAKPRVYLRHPAAYAGIVALNLRKFRLLKDFVRREALEDAVFYDYWLENSTLALSYLRRSGAIARAVARAHRFDLYDDCSELGAVPFRAFNVASLDSVFAISSHGLSFLVNHHPEAREKLVVSRLGVERQEPVSVAHADERPLIVSSARLVAHKRVHMIPDLLAAIGRRLRWVHLGDGPDRSKVERAASALPDRVEWKLAGSLEHDRVLDFFRTNSVALFVSLSASEGLPVSMMEAISFGVPVLATSVDGVPEIVGPSTGRLVALDEPIDEVARAVRELLDGEGPTRDEIIQFSRTNFDAETNFGNFAEMLQRL
jgi:glycosyltransferase involved in cell wall biosynthesis